MLWRLWGPLTRLYYRGWPLTQVQTHAMETLGPINLADWIIKGGVLIGVTTIDKFHTCIKIGCL